MRALFVIAVFLLNASPIWAQTSSFNISVKSEKGPTLSENEFQCDTSYKWVDEAPFHISDQFKNTGRFPHSRNAYERNWDNFRLMQDSEGVIGFLPQRSIVRLINPKHRKYIADAAKRTDRVPVEVLSVPENRTLASNLKLPNDLRDILASRLDVVPEKDNKGNPTVGRIHANALVPAGKFTYLVTKDTFLTKIPGLDDTTIGKTKAVRLVTSGQDPEKYSARKCCLKTAPDVCWNNYQYELLDRDLKKLDVPEAAKLEFNPLNPECSILNDIRAVDQDKAMPLIRVMEEIQNDNPDSPIDEIEYIDSMGLMKFPFEYHKESGLEIGTGPYNSTHYKPDGGAAMYDSYVNATTGCAFMQVLKQWNKTHPKNNVQVGNMWHLEAWRTHRSHEAMNSHGGAQGTCIDIRPFASGASYGPLRVSRSKKSDYSTKVNREFAQLLKRAGADTILLNDSKIKETSYIRGHDDHIHVCFNPNSDTVKNTCDNGL